MYNLLTGVIPVESILRATKKMLPPSAYNSNVTPQTEKAILKAMEVKPEDRFQVVKELLASIDIPPYELSENTLTETNKHVEDDSTEVLGTLSSGATSEDDDDRTVVTPSASRGLTENTLTETAHLDEDDNTEVLGNRTSDAPHSDDEDDRTIIKTPINGQNTTNKAAPKKNAKRRVLLLTGILIFAFIGYAVYSYFLDIPPSQGINTGIDLPGDSANITNNNLAFVNHSDSTVTPDDTLQSSLTQDTQNNLPNQNRPTQTKPETTNNSNPSSQPTTSSGNVDADNDNNSAMNNRNNIEKTYQQLMASANDRYENGNYEGALEYLSKALEMVETHKVGSKDVVEPMIKLCNDKENERKIKERWDKYDTYHKLGELTVVREKKTRLYGAINAEGIEDKIKCIYKTFENHKEGCSFKYEDGRSDIFNVKGELVIPK